MEQDAWADLEAIGLPAVGQGLSLGHGFGQAGNQPIGPIEIVVFEQRVVDVADDDVLFGAVGDRRVERFGHCRVGRIEDLLVPVGVGIGIVAAADDGQEARKRNKDPESCHGRIHDGELTGNRILSRSVIPRQTFPASPGRR